MNLLIKYHHQNINFLLLEIPTVHLEKNKINLIQI